jgi:hypothetical protein
VRDWQWQRIGAFGGVAFVVLFLISFFTPSTPDVDATTSEVVSEITNDRTGLVLSVYIGSLSAAAFLVFAGGLWSVLRRAGAEGLGIVTLVAAGATSALVLAANATLLALVYAAEEAREPEAVRALFELDNVMFVPLFFPLIVFHGAAALGIVVTRALPTWLGWVSALVALAYVVGLLGVFDADHEGGALGILVFIGLLVSFLWVLVTSIFMLRARYSPEAGARTST